MLKTQNILGKAVSQFRCQFSHSGNLFLTYGSTILTLNTRRHLKLFPSLSTFWFSVHFLDWFYQILFWAFVKKKESLLFSALSWYKQCEGCSFQIYFVPSCFIDFQHKGNWTRIGMRFFFSWILLYITVDNREFFNTLCFTLTSHLFLFQVFR